VAVDDGKILLVRRGRGAGQGLWSVPGGRVEPGETLPAAVQRELAEETAVAGECGQLLGVAERIGREYHFVILDYLVSVVPGQRAVAGDDAFAAAWVTFEELARLDASGELVPGLLAFLREHGVL
jgi:ADP-ribose pyrophosphatase YjhB (NUDIX family)